MTNGPSRKWSSVSRRKKILRTLAAFSKHLYAFHNNRSHNKNYVCFISVWSHTQSRFKRMLTIGMTMTEQVF